MRTNRAVCLGLLAIGIALGVTGMPARLTGQQKTTSTVRIDADDIGDDASIDTIEAWDSLKHLNLVLALEERFSVSFNEEETVEILNYELIRTVLTGHGVAFAT